MIKTLVSLLLLPLLVGCSGREHSILPQDLILREGDVVTRRGSGVTSHIVCTVDSIGEYSHVGIVAADSTGRMVIIHAVPGETDSQGRSDMVKADSPEFFFSSQRAKVGGVWRPVDSVVGKRAALRARQLLARNLQFDHDYDDADTSRLYCCQLVEMAYQSAGISLARGRKHSFSIPTLSNIKCMLPADLYTSPELQAVAEF